MPGSATSYEAIEFYRERFGIRRAVLPRVLSLTQVAHTIANMGVEIEEPTSLDTLALLPEFVRIGVAAIKIEGRQRSPAASLSSGRRRPRGSAR